MSTDKDVYYVFFLQPARGVGPTAGTLTDRLAAGQPENLAFIGVRKVGKTVLLFKLEEVLAARPSPVFIYLYVEPGSFRDFCISALIALLSQTAIHLNVIERVDLMGLSRQEKLQRLAQVLLPVFPRLSSQWVEMPLLIDREPETIFSTLFELAAYLGDEKDLHFLLVFDEFQNIRSFGVPTLEHKLRQHLLRQRRFALLVAGSSISAIEDMFRNRQNPLFGHFKIELIKPFAFPDARGFLLDKLSGHVLLNETQLAFLVQLSGGYPYYLDVLSDEILNRLGHLKRASDTAIADVVLSTVFLSNGLIYTYLAYLIEAAFQDRGYKTYLNLLQAIAGGAHAAVQIAGRVRQSKEHVSTTLRRLVDMGFLYRSEARYFFLDPLLELWLREVYRREGEMNLLGIRERYTLFKSQIEQMLATFKQELGKGNEARLRELFAAFDGRASLGRRRLPRFERVTSGILNDDEFDVLAYREDGHLWVAEVRDRTVEAAAVQEFVRKLHRLTDIRVETGILVCLAGYGAKVPAIAQAEGIMLWSLEDVNFLLRLYGKYPILA